VIIELGGHCINFVSFVSRFVPILLCLVKSII
jgi:hypothetical protein